MAYAAKAVADSVGPNGIRLVTLELTYPLIIHNELMTHRILARNVASNRAIPVQKMIDAVINDPFIPDQFPRKGKGMQPGGYWPVDSSEHAMLYEEWMTARVDAVGRAQRMLEIGCHKEITNRLLAPWLWTTAVVTSTFWANLLHLRCDEHAQRQMHKLADHAQLALFTSKPRWLKEGEWHVPYCPEAEGLMGSPFYHDLPRGNSTIDPENLTRIGYWLMVSVGRTAAVSYLRQGEEIPPNQAFDTAINRIIAPGHWSPTEHQAMALPTSMNGWYGNLYGWGQFRKRFPAENQRMFEANLPELIGSLDGGRTPVWHDPTPR